MTDISATLQEYDHVLGKEGIKAQYRDMGAMQELRVTTSSLSGERSSVRMTWNEAGTPKLYGSFSIQYVATPTDSGLNYTTQEINPPPLYQAIDQLKWAAEELKNQLDSGAYATLTERIDALDQSSQTSISNSNNTHN